MAEGGIAALIVLFVGAFVAYVIIRLAVRHALLDAEKRRR